MSAGPENSPAGLSPAVVARAAADSLDALAASGRLRSALAGFDGFIDSILHLVDTRRDMTPDGATRLRSIAQFAERCAAAAGRSTNIEQVWIEDRFGGNGPLLAGALASLGMPTTYIGAVAEAKDKGNVHKVFEGFSRRCRAVIPLSPPSSTLCLEFDDGKIMLNETSAVQSVTWERVVAVVGMDRLIRLAAESSLLGIVNWSLLWGVGGIWRGLAREVLPKAYARTPRELRVFIDLSDPAKRRDEDIRDALDMLGELERLPGVGVTLGLNLAEAERIARVAGAGEVGTTHADEALQDAAVRVRRAVGLDCVVIHPRDGAAAATAAGQAGVFQAPLAQTPKISTGGGDHFNAGFAFAQVHALPLNQCLATGCTTSGLYVRSGESPSLRRVTEGLRAMGE